MVIKPTSIKDMLKTSPKKVEVKLPKQRIVPVQKVINFQIKQVAEVMSNTLLGLYSGYLTRSRRYRGITFVESLNQYVIIHTSEDETEEWYAVPTTDDEALELIIESGKKDLLEMPEFSRLKLLKRLNER